MTAAADPYRAPPEERVEYAVVYGTDPDAIAKKLTAHAADGFRVVPGGAASGGESRGIYYLMQRTTT